MSGIYKDCEKCGEPVHRNAKVTCKACGGPSPWAVATTEVLAEADVKAGIEALREAGVEPPYMVITPAGTTVIADENAPYVEPTDEQIAAFLERQKNPPLTAEQIVARDAKAARDAIDNSPHVIMENFSCMIGVTLAHFKPGEVIKDFVLLGNLRALKAPMVPVTNAPGMTCCPSCQHVFKVPVLVPAKRAG